MTQTNTRRQTVLIVMGLVLLMSSVVFGSIKFVLYMAGKPGGPSDAQVVSAVRAKLAESMVEAVTGIKVTDIKNRGCWYAAKQPWGTSRGWGDYLCSVEVNTLQNGKATSSVSTMRFTKRNPGQGERKDTPWMVNKVLAEGTTAAYLSWGARRRTHTTAAHRQGGAPYVGH